MAVRIKQNKSQLYLNGRYYGRHLILLKEDDQDWHVIYLNRYLIFKNSDDGKCLDSDKTGKVYQIRCNNGDNQKWEAIDYNRYRNKATSRCLDSDSRSVYTNECNTDGYQAWTLKGF